MGRVKPQCSMSLEKKKEIQRINDMAEMTVEFDVHAAGQAYLTRVRKQGEANKLHGGKHNE